MYSGVLGLSFVVSGKNRPGMIIAFPLFFRYNERASDQRKFFADAKENV